MELRPYQNEAVDAIIREWDEGHRKTLLVLPTGCGKTIVFSKINQKQVDKGHRALILAHRGELLNQAANKLMQACELPSVLEKAESSGIGSDVPVTVGSVQTLCRDTRLHRFPTDYFTDIIVDEAHHCLSDSYQKVLNYFPDANILGVTATPDRGNQRNLGAFFDSKAYEYSMAQAIREGYLCPVKAQMIPLELDIGSVGMSNGDYAVNEIGCALAPYLRLIAHEMAKYCQGTHTSSHVSAVSERWDCSGETARSVIWQCPLEQVYGDVGLRRQNIIGDGRRNRICEQETYPCQVFHRYLQGNGKGW